MLTPNPDHISERTHVHARVERQRRRADERKIGGTDAQMPTVEPTTRKDTTQIEFKSYTPKIRKPGTGCVTMINDHLYEGRYTPTNAYGKRESHNIYAKTREEFEEKLAELVVKVKAQIKVEKEKMTFGYPVKICVAVDKENGFNGMRKSSETLIFRGSVVGVTGFEPAASTSQTNL